MNVFTFTGGLGKDCIKKFTQKGDAVTSFSVAVNSGFGENKVTTWANCTLWGKQAESLEPYLLKGVTVGISGELTLRKYENKDGTKDSNLDVRVSSVTLLSKSSGTSTSKQENKSLKDDSSGFDELESDLPF